MSNVKATAESLKQAGWTEAQIDRYYTLLDRKKVHGLSALSPENRAYIRSAYQAVEKFEQTRLADLAAAAKRRVSGVQPVETKLHYRWLEMEAELIGTYVEIAPGEVSALQIMKTEICRALSKYQPVLDQIDTSRRSKFDAPLVEMLRDAEAMSGARHAQFDVVGYVKALKSEFTDKWNDSWDKHYNAMAANSVVFADNSELDYRKYVRPQIELLVREVFPSVARGPVAN